MTLGDFMETHIGSSDGSAIVAHELPIGQPSTSLQQKSQNAANENEVLYASPFSALDGGYRSLMTIDIVCKMDQFKSLCAMLGLRSAFGDVKQYIYLDFDAERKDVYVKADGHKPLFKFDW